MKTQQNKLNVILKEFDVELFYNISFTKHTIYLQGIYSSSLLLRIRKYFNTELAECKETISDNGFIVIKVDGVKITLTE